MPQRRFLKIHLVVSHREGKQKFPVFLCFFLPVLRFYPAGHSLIGAVFGWLDTFS